MTQTGGRPLKGILSDLEVKIIRIIGDAAIYGLNSSRNDPLDSEDVNQPPETVIDFDDHELSSSTITARISDSEPDVFEEHNYSSTPENPRKRRLLRSVSSSSYNEVSPRATKSMKDMRIVSDLNALLNEHNELLKIFKSHMHKLQSANHAIVINPDKTPAGEYIRRFNAPVVEDVAGIMVGDRTGTREIVIRRRNNNLQFIADTHRSYDALQYPLIFWKRQDGYCINIKQRDPVSGAETNKNVSSKDYYAYRLMIRRGLENGILRCRELCQQFIVDMYAKIEGERLRYLRYNQLKLRAEESFTYETLLTTTPTSPKLQKRGLPHAHILVWLIDKIRPEEIDSIISAEIPDPSADQVLFDIVTANMIHGPCGTLHRSSPCMAHGKCTKNFPKDFTNDTIKNTDGYPIYRRRSPDNGGYLFIKNISNTDIDNRWVVPYSPLLSKTYNAHINVEFCTSLKSIKYIFKYVHKGSDTAVFRVENTNVNAPPMNKSDEITLYQIGRYISSNEADPVVVHLAVHLENGQRVFFTNETMIDRATNPPKTILTAFFELCNSMDDFGAFARTLLYSQVPQYFTWAQTKNGWPASKAHQLMHVSIYLNRTLWGDYLQLIQDTLNIRKVNGQQYPTYKDACLALGLLEDDNQWECMLAEAALNCTAIQIRLLFAIVLTTCFPARAQILWDSHKD
ncbi:uncharacterized protein [Diabrotica undecimpunctata]|uniref:uncharacterized protein n=1 Tax=Diabrotica undecimpunctata TaxID=50387 RepID=UPI003B632313